MALTLYGTGIRNASDLSDVTVKINGTPVEVMFAGAQEQYVGLDQVNVRLPATLRGAGEVDLQLTVSGKPANTVRIAIQ